MKTLLAIILVAVTLNAFADVDTFADKNDVTLAGHDVVAYFTEGKPVLGNPEYTAVHDGVIYRFSSKANRKKFSANPAKYAPQYGGFCAYGAALGKKLEVDGKAFEVVDGKLYVNKNLDVYETWVEDKQENIETADANWVTIKSVPAKDL